MTIKLDIEKAYNRLDGEFIKKCFIDSGFSNKWINWIMQCIKTTSFKVIVNGKLTSNHFNWREMFDK